MSRYECTIRSYYGGEVFRTRPLVTAHLLSLPAASPTYFYYGLLAAHVDVLDVRVRIRVRVRVLLTFIVLTLGLGLGLGLGLAAHVDVLDAELGARVPGLARHDVLGVGKGLP